jgi:hypothetical protein
MLAQETPNKNMARRRMFSLDVVHEDKFLDMPFSSQALYFHLGMVADDDGFVGNASSIIRQVGAKEDDLKVLLAKGFIIDVSIEIGDSVFVVTHWKLNNEIKIDRYKPTIYDMEKKRLSNTSNKAYYIAEKSAAPPLFPKCIHSGYILDPQYRLEKNSEDEHSEVITHTTPDLISNARNHENIQVNRSETKGKQANAPELAERKKRGSLPLTPPTLEDVMNYITENGYFDVDAKKFFDYYSVSDWRDKDGNPVKNWKQKIITWSGRNTNKKGKTVSGTDAEKDYSIIPSGYASL